MPRSALSSYERDLLRTFLAERPVKTIATWHPVTIGDDIAVRVTFTEWGRRDVISQEGVTVQGLRDAWHAVVGWLRLPAHVAADKHAFTGWAQLGRR